jgi:LemA protein
MTAPGVLGTLVVLLGLVGLALALGYNQLVQRRNGVDLAFGTLDAMLQLRFDLIPNLVEVARASAAHERETLVRCAEARRQPQAQSVSPAQLENAATLGRSIGRLIALAEAHPDLKAGGQFELLMRNLNEAEERISAARRTYNAMVMRYNTAQQSFPVNLVAASFGHRRRGFFEADRDAALPVPVKDSR